MSANGVKKMGDWVSERQNVGRGIFKARQFSLYHFLGHHSFLVLHGETAVRDFARS